MWVDYVGKYISRNLCMKKSLAPNNPIVIGSKQSNTFDADYIRIIEWPDRRCIPPISVSGNTVSPFCTTLLAISGYEIHQYN